MAMNLLGSFPDLHITFLADRRALKRIPQELSAYPELVKRFKGRYRVVPMTNPNGPEIPDADQDEIGKEVASVFESILERIFKGDKDAESEAFRAVPSATIVDVSRASLRSRVKLNQWPR